VVAVSALPVREPTKVVEVTDVKPARVVLEAPSAIAVLPTVIELFNSLALAIEPASIVLVTVPVSPVVTIVPVTAGRVIVFVPAVAVAAKVIVPEVEPFNRMFFPAASAKCSEEVHAVVALTQLNVLSVAPLRVIPPPSAVVLVGDAILPNSIFLSSTVSVVELTVVVVPFTVKSPVTVKLPPTAVLPPILTAPAIPTPPPTTSVPVPVVVDVVAAESVIVATFELAPRPVTVCSVSTSAAEEPFAAAVIRPCASTVMLALVYEPAVTAVFASAIVTAAEPLNDVPLKPVPIVSALATLPAEPAVF